MNQQRGQGDNKGESPLTEEVAGDGRYGQGFGQVSCRDPVLRIAEYAKRPVGSLNDDEEGHSQKGGGRSRQFAGEDPSGD